MSTPKFGNVFFSNEPKTVDITVSSGATGPFRGDLTVHVVDAYGTEVVATTAPLGVAAGSAEARTVTLESGLNGLFTVDVGLTASDGSAPLTKSTTLAVVPPLVTPGFDDASGIGYYLHPAPFEIGQAEDIAGQLQHFGVKWVRLNYVWRDGRIARPDTGNPGWLDTAAYETWVDALRRHGIQVVCQISGLARWASSQPDQTGANRFGLYPNMATRSISADRSARTTCSPTG
ncbi:MAG: hypothetical protein ACREQL_07545 [Candidatus Binatia bacterium]